MSNLMRRLIEVIDASQLTNDDMKGLEYITLVKQGIKQGHLIYDRKDGIEVLDYETDTARKLAQGNHHHFDVYNDHFPARTMEYWIRNGLTEVEGDSVRAWLDWHEYEMFEGHLVYVGGHLEDLYWVEKETPLTPNERERFLHKFPDIDELFKQRR